MYQEAVECKEEEAEFWAAWASPYYDRFEPYQPLYIANVFDVVSKEEAKRLALEWAMSDYRFNPFHDGFQSDLKLKHPTYDSVLTLMPMRMQNVVFENKKKKTVQPVVPEFVRPSEADYKKPPTATFEDVWNENGTRK